MRVPSHGMALTSPEIKPIATAGPIGIPRRSFDSTPAWHAWGKESTPASVGALMLCWWLQRARFLAIAILFVIAVPVVGSIGYAGLSSNAALIVATFCAGLIVLGIPSGINVVGAMIYPTSLRANGSGWQLGIGRLG